MSMKNKKNRIVESDKIGDCFKYERTVQNQNKKGSYLLVNIPYKIVKNMNIKEGQDVLIGLSRDSNGKRIIVIEPDNIKQIPDQKTPMTIIEGTTSASYKENESTHEPINNPSDKPV